jgi:uncharacterized membrane protein YfcA
LLIFRGIQIIKTLIIQLTKGDGMVFDAVLLASGIVVGIGASFSGLGGGFLMIPLLLYAGYSAQKAVGTSFLAILVISSSIMAIVVYYAARKWF